MSNEYTRIIKCLEKSLKHTNKALHKVRQLRKELSNSCDICDINITKDQLEDLEPGTIAICQGRLYYTKETKELDSVEIYYCPVCGRKLTN